MALLQVRHGVGTFNTLRVVFLSAIIIICTELLSANAFLSSGQDKGKGPEPLIKLVVHPQEHVIIPIQSYAFLHCEANYTGKPDEDYENDDPGIHEYLADDTDLFIGQNDSPTNDLSLQSSGSNEATVKNPCQQEVQYQWQRNGKPISGDSNSSFIQTFCNGTIKIKHTTMAAGIYRCVASTTQIEDGAVISKASNVQAAVFERRVDKLSSKAELGSSVVLNCPIESIPNASILWTFDNESHIYFDTSERYFQLYNGSLLIVNVKNEDFQTFRCSAQNEILKTAKQIQHSLKVINSITANNARLLPPLQDEAIFIPNGSPLTLHCAPTSTASSKGNAIRWTFTNRAPSSKPIDVPTLNPNQLRILNTSIDKNDGIYKCYFGDQHQVFNITITTPPIIHEEFTSKECVLGYYTTLNCNVTGNPKPNVQWYRDGKLLKYDWIVTFEEPKLVIHTYEEMHKGIYQCVATNMAGEAQATGLLSLRAKQYNDAPKNVKCLPMNATTFKVTFEGPQNYRWSAITYYMASRHEPKWSTKMIHDLNSRVQNEFMVSDSGRSPFEPIMLYFRGMERIGSDTKIKGGATNYQIQYDLSRLSDGIKCATQGLPVHGMFSPNRIFVWWPRVEHINVTDYLIQFKSDETTAFSDHVIGTTRIVDEFETWNDVSNDLTNIPATTNIYPNDEKDDSTTIQSADSDKKSSSITELRVNGNVTGILIPNTREIIVRVLVPVVDEDGELAQDMRYVEWKKIQDISGDAKLKVYTVASNRVTFQLLDPNIACVRICYKNNDEKTCNDRSMETSYVEVDSLSAFTSYKFRLLQCDGTKALYNEFDIQTKHDTPGAVTNHKYCKDDGIVIEWGAPVNANGILTHYLIEWTVANQTHAEKIPYQSEVNKNKFKFPDVQESDRFNITIRAVSNFGVGNPIHVDLRNVKYIPDDCAINASAQRDPRLGISIGVLLSILCVIICAFIIIRHRRCSKSPHHQHVNGNGNNTRNTFPNRSPINHGPVAGAATVIPTSSGQITNCNMDAHEMQTLIMPSNIENIAVTNGNGPPKRPDNHMNGVVVPRGNRNSFSNTQSTTDEEETSDLSRCGLISSTPKSKRKPQIIAKNDHLNNTSTNFGVQHTAQNPVDTTTAYRRMDYDIEAHGGELASNLFDNALMQPTKTTLPPNKSVHSIALNASEIPPTIKRIADEKAKRSSTHVSSVSIPSILDDSQQSLLPDANATESSSASTSSGCVPMDRVNNTTNCIFDTNTFDNGAPHAIVENQRYMRSAALV